MFTLSTYKPKSTQTISHLHFQVLYGDKPVPKSSGHNRILPLGYDRAGRVYWNLGGRIVV